MRVTVHRKAHFNAAHRLYRKDWSFEQNDETFGKCNNPHYHGHNYELIVSVTGNIDPETGYVVDMKVLKDIIKSEVEDKFDHKNLNKETKGFARLNPTVENMVKVFWDLLVDEFEPVQLTRIGVWETPRTYAEYSGLIDMPLQHSDHV